MSELHIFVDSERPDQYLNSIVHCILDREVRVVTFLHIESLTSQDSDRVNPGLSARVMAAVQSLLESLAERKEYIASPAQAAGRVNLAVVYGDDRAAAISDYYRRVRELPVVWSNKGVAYTDLRASLAELSKKGSTAYLDVTAVKKRYLGDIVAAALVEGVKGLWTFDLLASVDFSKPWTMLMHDLVKVHPTAYRYTNLLDTATYRDCVRQVFVRAPRYRRSAYGVIALIVVSAIGYLWLGEDSGLVRFVMAMSGIASIVALALVFTPPRTEA